MKRFIKYIVAILFMSTSLFIGLKVGNSQGTVTVEDPNGYVCGDSPGSCDPNWNETCCSWGGSGCDTTPGDCS